MLRPVHKQTEGHDGYISFECTPDVAYSTTETVAQAIELWETAGRAERDDQGARH